MIKLANQLVGGQFLGANKANYSDAKVLYEITSPPKPYFLNYLLKNKDKYRYYKFVAPKEFPNANISRLEWITYKQFDYPNSMQATRAHIITNDSDAIENLMYEANYVKLRDAPSWDKMNLRTVCDGNMQTAPTGYPSIFFRPPIPCIVTHVRFSPKNADNGIKSGDTYELYYWDMGWQYGGSCQAEFEFASFDNIPTNKLYWLVNKSRGAEELPFIIIDGKQHFLYPDILN